MTVMNTGISWTDSTWNPTVGCTKVSAGCTYCYAESQINRLYGAGTFDTVVMHRERLKHAYAFRPVVADGTPRPRRVFVNSVSDLMHTDIPDSFRDLVFDAIEAKSDTWFQVLTKRPMTLRRYIEERYKGKGVPKNLALGVSVEDDRVRNRLDIVRRLKDAVGDFTALASIEPLIGPIGHVDLTGIDQAFIGGESPQHGCRRPMLLTWAQRARDKARQAGAAVWFKQYGDWWNNPLYCAAAKTEKLHLAKVRRAIELGEREAQVIPDPKREGKFKIVGEKGGATLDGEVLHEEPKAYLAMCKNFVPVAAKATPVQGGLL